MEDTMQNPAQVMPTDDDLKAKYEKVFKVCATVTPDDESTVDFKFIFKKPATASYDRYLKTAKSGITKATQTFLYDNIVEEYRQNLEDALKDYPALSISIAEKLLAMLGLSEAVNLTTL